MIEGAAARFACQTYIWQMSRDRYRGRLDHMATVAADAGFSALEPEVIMLGDHTDPVRVGEVLSTAGLQLASLVLVADWRGPGETPEERVEADRCIRFVQRFPGAVLLLVQMPGENRRDLTSRRVNAIRRINAVASRARDGGVHATFHPNSPQGSVFRTAADYAILLAGLDPAVVGFTPDVGHIAAGGMDPLDVIKQYRSRVDHIHLKDIDRAGTWAPTGEGVIDFGAIVSYLHETGFAGWIVLEDESATAERDPDAAVRKNGEYVRRVLAPIVDGPRRRP